MSFKTRSILIGISTVLALSLVAVFSVQGATIAQITTSQKLYSVGQTMVINGTGFTPSAYIYLTVQRPDKLTDSVLPQPFTNGSGGFTASYTPPLIPGRYTITATDGSNTAVTAVTEADAIGYNKGVYNKSATTPEDTTGNWTTGNAGSHYLENQWAFYQYEITGVGSTVPSFDVTFNHFQANTNAVFVDALADFRACVDCTDSSHTSGPSQGMLLDTVPLPPSDITNWVLAAGAISNINRPLNSLANGLGATVLTGSSGFCSSNTPEPIPDLVTTFPAEFHCFHVDGTTLGALFPTLSAGTHTITIYYAAHLAASFVWGNGTAGVGGHEGSLGDCNSPFYVRPLTGPLASFEPISTTTCLGFPVVYGTDDYAGWTAAGFGVGFATGSSRHFSLSNQSAGSSGAIDLPIPTVAAPTNTIIITKVTNPAVATGVPFPYTGTLGSFTLDTDPGTATPNSKTFPGIAAGITFTVTEGAVAGWTNTALSCAVTAGTDTGGSFTTDLPTSTASLTFGPTDGGVTVTCTYTNSGAGHIIVQKHTTPSATGTSFPFTTQGTGYTGFSLLDGGSNTDGGSPPAGGLTPGTYTVSENAVAGWVLAGGGCSLTTSGSGTSTFPTSVTPQPASIVLGAGDTVTCVYNNSQPAGSITVAPSGTNEINHQHVFTITATQAPNGATPATTANITFAFTPSNPGTVNSNCGAAVPFSGNTATCTVTINNGSAGTFTINATASFTVGGVVITKTTDGVGSDSGPAKKTFVDARISLTPQTATNEVNTPHTITATVQQDDGLAAGAPGGDGVTGFGPAPNGTLVTFSLLNNAAGATFVAGNTCTTTSGTCTVQINSTTPGGVDIHATTTFLVGGVSLTRASGDGLSGDSPNAHKTYILSATTLTFNSSLSTPNTATGGIVEAGQTVTVVVTETNTGSDTITGVNVTGGGACTSFTGGLTTLTAGQSTNFTCTFLALAGLNSWTATGHGIDSLGHQVPTTGETAAGSVFGDRSSTTLTFNSTLSSPNTATGGIVEAGQTVTVVVTETNTGNNTLTGVSVTGTGSCASFSGGLATLTAGQSTNFTCTFTANLGTNSWSATGNGTDSDGHAVPTTGETTSGSVTGVLSNLIVVKHTTGGNGTFNFTGSGVGVPASFPITTSGGTGSVTFSLIHSGAKTISELVPTHWLGNTLAVSCTTLVIGTTPSAFSSPTVGTVAAGGTIEADVTLGIGATVRCDFYNSLLPTLTIVKTVQGTGTATFDFPVTDNTNAAGSLNPSITPPPAPSTASFGPQDIATDNYTILETPIPAGWTLTDFKCTGATGPGTGAGPLDSNGVPTSWNFIANFGNNVVCTFINNNAQATRTQGFWATHTKLSNDVWDGTNPTFGTVLPAGASPVIGSGDEVFGPGAGCPVAFTITAIPVKAENILMGGFWAGISKTSTATSRTAIDHARMQMIQQYLAAVLNFHMFGSIGEGVLANARAVYCGTSASAIQAEIGILGNLNQSGDLLGTTPGGSATTKTSKAQADIDAWDTPTDPVD